MSPTKEIQLPNFQCLTGGVEVRNLTYRLYQYNSDIANFPRITQQCWHHWELIPVPLSDRKEYKSLHHAHLPFVLLCNASASFSFRTILAYTHKHGFKHHGMEVHRCLYSQIIFHFKIFNLRQVHI